MATKKQTSESCFQSSKSKVCWFFDKFHWLAEDAFGLTAHAFIEQIINVEMPPHLKKVLNRAHMENGTYEQIYKHFEKEIELYVSEATS